MELVTPFLERKSNVQRKGGLAMSLTSHIVRTLFTIGDFKTRLGWVPPTNVEAIENVPMDPVTSGICWISLSSKRHGRQIASAA